MARAAFVALCLALSSALVSGGAFAAPATGAKPSDKLDLAGIRHALENGSEADKLAALATLAEVPSSARPGAALAVNELLARGASVAVLSKALDVAEKLAQPSSSGAVVPYVRHRAGDVRRAATRALAKTGGADAVAALRGALRSNDKALRGVAARGLATLHAKEAVPDLFAVLTKDVPEAAGAIGELCSAADCVKFVDLLGKLPFDAMQSGLEPLILRPETEVSAELKLDVLERLRKLQTDEARAFLKTVRARYPEKGNARVKWALEQAVNNKPVLEPKKP